jgi:ATP-dependent Clp protease, protease subunit
MTDDTRPQQFTEQARAQLLFNRTIVLDGVLDDDNGLLLASQLMMLATDDPEEDIAFWIHSPGGSVSSMLAIRDVMRIIPCDVATVALGLAASAGQFLRYTRDVVIGLVAADTGQTTERIFEDSLHDRWYSATEAREYGFIDHVVESFDQVRPTRRRPVGIGAGL